MMDDLKFLDIESEPTTEAQSIVVLPMPRYEELLDCETRMEIIMTFLEESGSITVSDLCYIGGRPGLAREIKKKDDEWWEKRRKKEAEEKNNEVAENGN